jgi:hypothetical protein
LHSGEVPVETSTQLVVDYLLRKGILKTDENN